MPKELKKKENRLKKLQEAREHLERKKLEKINVTDPDCPLMRAKLRSEEGKKIYVQRLYTVEPVFGNTRWNGRKLTLNLRGLVKANGEFQRFEVSRQGLEP